jgi:hypothetical protein
VPNAPSDVQTEADAAAPPVATRVAGLPEVPKAIQAVEVDGPQGPEPTRYGDWERNGRCIDF